MSTAATDKPVIVYPECDGKPMADNTRQFRYIVAIQGGLDAQFADRPDVFVAGDNLWYPVEGHPEICTAPDVYVAFGRPKGDRGSYKQWEEGNIPPQVVFEVMSPNNTTAEMGRKLEFYRKYGVEEYYIYDPDRGTLRGYLRRGDQLADIPVMQGHVSPRLGVRFELIDGELQLYGPGSQRFRTFVELAADLDRERERREQAERLAEQERRQRQEVERQAAQAQQQAEQERQRAERLAALLREHGIDPPA